MQTLIENRHNFRKVRKPYTSIILTVPSPRRWGTLVSQDKKTVTVRLTSGEVITEQKAFWGEMKCGSR